MDSDSGPFNSSIWRKSQHSADQGNCVEVAADNKSVLVRDSRGSSERIMRIPSDQWQTLLRRVRETAIGGG